MLSTRRRWEQLGLLTQDSEEPFQQRLLRNSQGLLRHWARRLLSSSGRGLNLRSPWVQSRSVKADVPNNADL